LEGWRFICWVLNHIIVFVYQRLTEILTIWRYYEILDEAPWIFYLSQFISGAPQRGFGVLPKRGCDTMQCEIFRFYKLHATKDLVEPISMIVPRKAEIFQDDIYPETAAPSPSLSGSNQLRIIHFGPSMYDVQLLEAIGC